MIVLRRGAKRVSVLVCLLAIALLSLPAHAGLFKVSKRDEIHLGKEFYKEYQQEHAYLDSTPEGAHLKRVGQRLVQRNAITDWTFTFTLVDDKEVNAFAVPGGHGFMTTG